MTTTANTAGDNNSPLTAVPPTSSPAAAAAAAARSPPLSPAFRSAYPSSSSSSSDSASMFTACSSLSTARSSCSARLGTPTSPLLSHTLLSQGLVDSPADMPGGLNTFRSIFKGPRRELEPALNSFDLKDDGSAATHTPVHHSPGPPTPDKRRPRPLDLQSKRNADVQAAPLTNDSTSSNLSSEFEHLRRVVQQNLIDRPIDTSMETDDDECGRRESLPPNGPNSITPAAALSLIRSSKQVIVVDTRPLAHYDDAHLPRSAHVSIPDTGLNAMHASAVASHPAGPSWSSLAQYITTATGRRLWAAVDLHEHVDVILVGAQDALPDTNILAGVVSHAVPAGTASVLQGGWESTMDLAHSEGMVVNGETSDSSEQQTPIPRLHLPPQPAPTCAPMSAPAPSQTGGVTLSPMGRSLPSLSVSSAGPPVPRRHPPKLSLNVHNNSVPLPLPAKALSARSRPRPGGLTIDVGDSNRLSPGIPYDARGTMSAATPRGSHFSSDDVNAEGRNIGSVSQGESSANDTPTLGSPYHHMPRSPAPHASSLLKSAPPLEVSTILPAFLYLGPEIATRADVETLLSMGIRRVLNVAVELDDDENLGLRTTFERYYRIPMKDSVEESGVGEGIREACNILDDARLHSAPIYVHCKAGRSRSVTAVLAYLIHANAWTLKTSYAYVAERRHGISPNIGFVAELIQFEETELGGKSASKNPSDVKDKSSPATPLVPRDTKQMLRYTRESLPPEWSLEGASEEAGTRKDDIDPDHTPETTGARRTRQTAADIEVRKNGQWVHGRRAPVDRTTLQPGRRVSKAGLESTVMRPLEPAVPAAFDP